MKDYLIKATLIASLCALALVVAQNASYKMQVSHLQNELSLHQEPVIRTEDFLQVNKPSNLRRLGETVLERESLLEDLDDSEDGSHTPKSFSSSRRQRRNEGKRFRNLGSKSGSSKGSSKSSKKSSKKHCSSSRTNDSESDDSPTVEVVKCEDLRQALFDLDTEVQGLEAETLKYNANADELYQTYVIARAQDDQRLLEESLGGANLRRLADESYGDHIQDSLDLLRTEKDLLKTGNERVSQLNGFLRQSAITWLDENGKLSDANLALLRNLTGLTQENLELLNEQHRLSDQINSLNSTLDTYKDLLDQHADLNGELNMTTAELEAQINRLEAANAEYKRLNGELSGSIGELKNQNNELAEQNQILAGLNGELNNTIIRLDGQVDDLSDQIDRLENETAALEGQVDRLQNETDRLEQANDQLEANVDDLTDEVDRFVNKTDELQKLNDELENIVSFVNETGAFVDQTMDSVTEYLSEQIIAYRTVASETLKNTFIQRAALWDCAYRDHFGDDQFGKDDKVPIPPQRFDAVMDYVDQRVLSEICLTLDDFENFLDNKFDDPVYTTNHIVSGIASYAYQAFDFYFPDKGEAGLSEADWALAGYNCDRLPSDKRFVHDGVTF